MNQGTGFCKGFCEGSALWIGLLLIVLPIVSAFAYVFFDYTWWTPLDFSNPADGARGYLMFCFHIGFVALGALLLSITKDKT